MKKYFLALASLIFVFAGCSVMVDDFKNLKSGTSYKVVSNFESVETEGEYDPELAVTDEKFGAPGSLTDVEAAEVPGFTVKSFDQVKIAEDGSTVLNLYYDRNLVTLTFDPNGGTWEADGSTESISTQRRYGTLFSAVDLFITADDVVKDDWGLSGWEPPLPEKVPAAEETYVAQWSQNFADYTVEYLFEQTDGSYVVDDEKTVVKKGIIDAVTSAAALLDADVPNYDLVLVEGVIPQSTIAADGSTVVQVKYNLKTFTACFYGNGGQWGEETFISVQGKLGAALAVPATDTLLKEDYEFTGKWLDAADGSVVTVDSTFTQNRDYYAQWNQVNAAYKVVYSTESVDGTMVADETKTEILKGKIGDTATKTGLDAPDGFDMTVTPAVITQDGSAEVSVQYTRKTITVYLDSGSEGSWSTGTKKTLTGKYDTVITLPEEPSSGDWTFIGWKDLPAKFPAESGLTYTAEYSKSVVYYKVQYRFQSVDGSSYEVVQTDASVKGAPGKTTNASAGGLSSSSEGFTAKEVTNVSLTEASTPDNTVVNVDFDRNSYKIYFVPGDGAWSDGDTSKYVEGVYGAEVKNVPATSGAGCLLTREDYKCTGWDKTVPSTFPAQDVTLTAVWALEYATYTISTSYQNADGTYGAATVTAGDSKIKIGETTGKTASDFAAPGTEYTTPVVTDVTVTDVIASNVVVVKYPRKTITYTFNLNGGKIEGNGSDVTKTGLYGSSFGGVGDIVPVKTNYVFAGWNKTPDSTYIQDASFTAVWNSAVSINTVTAGDIVLSKNVTGKTATFAVTVPYTSSEWKFEWYVDGAKASNTEQSATFSSLKKGKHQVMVVAKENGVTFSKSVAVTITE